MDSDNLFDIATYVFPIVSGTPKQDHFAVDRFLGSGFWIDSKGHFLTCKHVLEDLKEGQCPAIGQPFGEARDRFIPILSSTAHPRYDVAVGTANVKTPTNFLPLSEGPIVPGLNVSAFGFTEWGKEGQSLNIDVRYLKGHVTRTSTESLGLPTKSVVELSFGSPSGFSGTPLLADFRVSGMLHNNIETKLQAYAITEVKDGDSEYHETAYRVYEYGIAHHRDDLLAFLQSCGINPFQ